LDKIFDKEELKSLIIYKYGSVDKYAKKLGITRATLYYRLDNINKNFIRDLEEDGIIPKESITNSNIVGKQYGGSNTNINNSSVINEPATKEGTYKLVPGTEGTYEDEYNNKVIPQKGASLGITLTEYQQIEINMLKKQVEDKNKIIELLEGQVQFLKNEIESIKKKG
jgi:hypothetical protein